MFKEQVLQVVSKIPKGQTLSYKQVAELAGSPNAYRVVGNIMNKNRNPNVPCHRVIRSDGQTGGFAFGTAKKASLLAQEKILTPDFFNRPTLQVAEELIGKYLVRHQQKLIITDVEAYDGPQDLACHASKGRTPRTEVMFGPAGRFYVYFCYGVHWMLNIVTGPPGTAILIRGAGDIQGPARLTKALQIDNSFNTKPAVPTTGLWFEESGITPEIEKSPRIGVDYAGPIWSKKPYRLTLAK